MLRCPLLPLLQVFNVTSKSQDAGMVQLSPFFCHNGIPVPGLPGTSASSVERIWQCLKVRPRSHATCDSSDCRVQQHQACHGVHAWRGRTPIALQLAVQLLGIVGQLAGFDMTATTECNIMAALPPQVFEHAPEDLASLTKQGMKGVKRTSRKNGKVSLVLLAVQGMFGRGCVYDMHCTRCMRLVAAAAVLQHLAM